MRKALCRTYRVKHVEPGDIAALIPRAPDVKSSRVGTFKGDVRDLVVLEEAVVAAALGRAVRAVLMLVD